MTNLPAGVSELELARMAAGASFGQALVVARPLSVLVVLSSDEEDAEACAAARLSWLWPYGVVLEFETGSDAFFLAPARGWVRGPAR